MYIQKYKQKPPTHAAPHPHPHQRTKSNERITSRRRPGNHYDDVCPPPHPSLRREDGNLHQQELDNRRDRRRSSIYIYREQHGNHSNSYCRIKSWRYRRVIDPHAPSNGDHPFVAARRPAHAVLSYFSRPEGQAEGHAKYIT